MASQEERDLQQALAISAEEERVRQEKLRAAEAAHKMQSSAKQSNPYRLTGRPYAPAEAHHDLHMRNLTLSDPSSHLADNSIAPIYVPAPSPAQVPPYYAPSLYNPFAPPPAHSTSQAPYYYPPHQASYQPSFNPIHVPGNNPAPTPAPPLFNPFSPQVSPQPSSLSSSSGQRNPNPNPNPPQLRVSSPSPTVSPAHSSNDTTTVAPLSTLLPNSSPGVGRAPSPARRQLVRETTTLELALSVTNSLGFFRVPIPGDGACLFRAVSERLFGTQRRHRFIRRACVHYMENNSDAFKVFVEGSGYEYKEYLQMMLKETSWGGQVELQAMSMLFSVDFAIYSAKHDPVFIDNGFRRVREVSSSFLPHCSCKKFVALWFSHGSHYDLLYPMPEFAKITAAQELVYWLIARTFDSKLPFRPSSNYKYRNVEMERYEAHVRRREAKDQTLAAQLMSDEKKIDYLRIQQENDRDVARRLQEEEEDARLARALQLGLGDHHSHHHRHHHKKDKKDGQGFIERLKGVLPGADKPRSKSPSGRDDLRRSGHH